jgi:hypothetical protein
METHTELAGRNSNIAQPRSHRVSEHAMPDDQTCRTSVIRTQQMKPRLKPVNLAFIPAEVKTLRQWVNWKLVPNEKKPEKSDKPPIDPKTGRPASCSDPKTWSDFPTAVDRYQRCLAHGIGFQLTPPYVGIDLDGCRERDTGEIAPWALKIVRAFSTYCEVSPSGKGLHIILKGTLPPGGNVHKSGRVKIEMYDSLRYFTFSGRHLKETPCSIENRDAQLQRLHRVLFRKPRHDQNPETRVPATATTDGDNKLVERIRLMADGSRLKALWEGQRDKRYKSDSEADLALCTDLALKFGCNTGQVDSLFRKSRRFRDKWDERHEATGRTYGEMTLRKAIATACERHKEKYGVLTFGELTDHLQGLGNETDIVEGLIPTGPLGVLVGDSGLGKSPFLYQLALCVATGLPFLGHPVAQKRVLYLDYENSLHDVDEILNRLTRHLGLEERPSPKKLLLWNFNDPSHTGEPPIFEMLRDFGPCFAIIDTMGSFKPGFDKNNEIAMHTIKELRGWARDTGSTTLGIHHPRKESRKRGEAPEPIEGDLRHWFLEMRGARALFNGSDVRLAVGEPKCAKTRVSSTTNAEIAFLLRGFRKVHGEIPWTYVGRSFDSSGMPLGYTKLVGEDLLFNGDQQAIFQQLPVSFRYKDARLAYGKGSQATVDFLIKCIALGILRKTTEGYQKSVKQS